MTEVNNSNGKELEGLKRCLDHLQEEQVVISKLLTDWHFQVRAHMKNETSQIICIAYDKVVAKKIHKKIRQNTAQNLSRGLRQLPNGND